MNIQPLGDQIVIRRSEAEEKTPGGIFIPDLAKQPLCEGTVVAVGPGARLPSGRLVEPQVRVGDVVMFQPYSQYGGGLNEVEVDGEEYLILREAQVMAVVRES